MVNTDGPSGSMKDDTTANEARITHGQREGSRPLVMRVRSLHATAGSVQGAPFPDTIGADAVHRILGEGMMAFTGAKDVGTAWRTVLLNYRNGDKMAIKPNFNFVEQGMDHTITSPQLLNAVVKQLIEYVGVPASNITVYDLCKKMPAEAVKRRISYPIRYAERADIQSFADKVSLRMHLGLSAADTGAQIEMRESIVDEDGKPVTCYMPKIVTQAQHLINMPLLTNHIYVLNSGALKNHYGTVRFSNYQQYPVALHGKFLTKSVTDINRNRHIKDKTRIIIADGIFGVFDRGEGSGKKPWRTLQDRFPESIFISRDPVAIDSVMARFVARERKARNLPVLPHEYLQDAAASGLGIFESPLDHGDFSRIQYRELHV